MCEGGVCSAWIIGWGVRETRTVVGRESIRPIGTNFLPHAPPNPNSRPSHDKISGNRTLLRKQSRNVGRYHNSMFVLRWLFTQQRNSHRRALRWLYINWISQERCRANQWKSARKELSNNFTQLTRTIWGSRSPRVSKCALFGRFCLKTGFVSQGRGVLSLPALLSLIVHDITSWLSNWRPIKLV